MTKINWSLSAALLVFAAAFTDVSLADDDKWVWGRHDGGQQRADSRAGAASEEVTRVAKPVLRDHQHKPQVLFQAASNPRVDTKYYRDEPLRNGRYEVNEDYVPDRDPLVVQPVHLSETYSTRPTYDRPGYDRPGYDRPQLLPLPTPQRPFSSFQPPPPPLPPHVRPQRPYVDSVHAPSRKPVAVATDPVGAAVGILTGPVPSWQKPSVHKNGDPTNFEKCKCSFSFNCKSPGIKFGSCDEGKQYCCYNDFDGANSGSKEIDKYGGDRSEPVPSILVGPGPNNRPGLRPGIYGQVSNKNEFIDRQEFISNSFQNERPLDRKPNEYGNNPFIIPRQI